MKRMMLAALGAAALMSLGLTACKTLPPPSPPSVEQQISSAESEAATLRDEVRQARLAEHPCCTEGTAAAATQARRLDTLALALQEAVIAKDAGQDALAQTHVSRARAIMTGIRSAMQRTLP